jgi:hypothetical protein
VWNSCAFGAGVGVNEFTIEVQVAVAPMGGYGGLDATVSWPDALAFQNVALIDCQNGFAVGEQRAISLSCTFDAHSDYVGSVFALAMTCAADGSGDAVNLFDTSFQGLGGKLGPPTLIDATIRCLEPQRGGPGPPIGDADCSFEVSSIDAALVLQYEAGLLERLDCQFAADVNRDGNVNSIERHANPARRRGAALARRC